jgi:hypothetical protein
MRHIDTFEDYINEGFFGDSEEKIIEKIKKLKIKLDEYRNLIEISSDGYPGYCFSYYANVMKKIVKLCRKIEPLKAKELLGNPITREIDIQYLAQPYQVAKNKAKLLPSSVTDLGKALEELENL